MMKRSLIPFAFDENMVRVHLDENGDPWFVAKDVAKSLAYADASNPARLVAHVPEEWKGVNPIHTLGGSQEMLCLSEQGLYFFLARSDKPKALPFQKWFAGEVLPALRKTGGYAMPGHGVPLADMPETALRLRPTLREKILASAMQAARLLGVSSPEEIDALYLHYCALVGGTESGPADEVREFFHERCVHAPGSRERVAALYEAFRSWRGRGNGFMPDLKSFSQNLARFARRSKSNHMVFHDISLRA